MNDKRQFVDGDTSTNATMPPRSKKSGADTRETSVPIPIGWVRWLFYTVVFANLLIPFHPTPWQVLCGGAILGHFASQLNALINKK